MIKINGSSSIFARPEDVRREAQYKLFDALQDEARRAGINYKNVPRQNIDTDGILQLLPERFPHDIRFAARGVHSISHKKTHSAGGWQPLSDEAVNARVQSEAAEIASELSSRPALAYIALLHLGGSVVTGVEAYVQQNDEAIFEISAGE